MSSLRTYDIPPASMGMRFIRADSSSSPLDPGSWVKDIDLGGFGIIIAITDEQITILWSKEPVTTIEPNPGFVFAPYVPLIVTPTILPPEDFKLTGFARYSKKSICKEFFGDIDISDIFKNSITPITGSKP